jgi:hypothetical protein
MISDDMNWVMTQIEEATERCNQAIKQQDIIYQTIKRGQQDELKEYFDKIKMISDLKKENIKLKMHEKEHA